jgi:hypothetical protein
VNKHLGMGPRKKSKSNDGSSVEQSKNTSSTSIAEPSNQDGIQEPISNSPSTLQEDRPVTSNGVKANMGSIRARNQDGRRTWYSGSWSSKSIPTAQIAKENIGVTAGATTELAATQNAKQATPDSPTKFLSKRKSSKGTPAAVSVTNLNVTSSSNENIPKPEEEESTPVPYNSKESVGEPPLPPDPTGQVETDGTAKEEPEQPKPADAGNDAQPTSIWRSWWSRPDGYSTAKATKKDKTLEQTSEEAQHTPLPGPTPSEEVSKAPLDTAPPATLPIDEPQNSEGSREQTTQGRSWFWLWSNAQNAQNAPLPDKSDDGKPMTGSETTETTKPSKPSSDEPQPELRDPKPVAESIQSNNTKPSEPTKVDADNSQNTTTATPASTSSGWAFWSRSRPRQPSDHFHKEIGELAVADTPSQSHPEAAQFNEREESPAPAKDPGREPAKEAAKSVLDKVKGKATSKSSTPTKATPTQSPALKPIDIVPIPAKQTEPSSKPQSPPNLLLPDFDSTFSFVQAPSIWEKLRRLFLGGEPDAPHLHKISSLPRIKKALAIGVHGYFPAPLIQKFIGQPTGTSIRFANAAANAISEWTEKHGYTCEITKASLEGEGFIEDRVSTLWKLLLNWIEDIKQADFILVACHSQGVPVAVQLVAKLIHFGCINNNAKIGICAMAGVNLGPFAEYKPRIFAGSASELFDFSNPKSKVSENYRKALEEVLKYGVKVVYVGSIDDQLVSLESSTFSNISHPYIYRAVFVDGRIHAPDL